MDSANQTTELNEAELATIQGGGIFDWVEDHIPKPAMALMRGNKPPPNVPVNPQDPFGYNPTNPGAPRRP
jgi:bacteriocin-like protein